MPRAARKRSSGPSQSKAARREAGRVRVEVWLSEDAAARLDRLRGERTRTEAIEELLLPVGRKASA